MKRFQSHICQWSGVETFVSLGSIPSTEDCQGKDGKTRIFMRCLQKQQSSSGGLLSQFSWSPFMSAVRWYFLGFNSQCRHCQGKDGKTTINSAESHWLQSCGGMPNIIADCLAIKKRSAELVSPLIMNIYLWWHTPSTEVIHRCNRIIRKCMWKSWVRSWVKQWSTSSSTTGCPILANQASGYMEALLRIYQKPA